MLYLRNEADVPLEVEGAYRYIQDEALLQVWDKLRLRQNAGTTLNGGILTKIAKICNFQSAVTPPRYNQFERILIHSKALLKRKRLRPVRINFFEICPFGKGSKLAIFWKKRVIDTTKQKKNSVLDKQKQKIRHKTT